MVLQKDLNRHGTLFGGALLSWMDLASAIAASEIMQMNCVTVAVDRIEFIVPVYLGDILTFEVEESSRGRTSLTLSVLVYKSNVKYGTRTTVAKSNFKFVAVDDNGKSSDAWNLE